MCSAFNPSKCTHTVVNIHLEQWAANAAAPGEQLGVRCLAQGSHLSRGIEGGESAGYSLPPPTIPAGPEIRTHNLLVTSPTLYPLGHDCPSGPRLPLYFFFFFFCYSKHCKQTVHNSNIQHFQIERWKLHSYIIMTNSEYSS